VGWNKRKPAGVAQALEIREQQQQLAADQRSKHHGLCRQQQILYEELEE
jgi:hypothetical protein